MIITLFLHEGSLTQPPCDEGVLWILLQENFLDISEADMNRLRTECTFFDETPMDKNHRPTQPLCGRVVKSSFDERLESKMVQKAKDKFLGFLGDAEDEL